MKSFINGEINEFVDWYDTDGNIINASDGGIIYVDGKYHWYGMALRPLSFKSGPHGGQMTDIGVIMYESSDLVNWKYEGVILEASNDPESELFGPLRFERPKIIYNEKTKQFVLWCHFVKYPGDHGVTDGSAELGIAVSDTVNGKYKWLGYQRPIDKNGFVRDMTVYKDLDGVAYLIYDRHVWDPRLGEAAKGQVEDRCLYAIKLSEDYLSFTETYKRIETAAWREAPCISYKDGYYYIITSGLSGWTPNQARAFRTKHILDTWEDIGDPCIDDFTKTTFNSQGSNVFKIEGTDTQIIMLERHNTGNFQRCSYIWLPIEFNEDNTVSLRYKNQWELN